jgi:hypothetical protein
VSENELFSNGLRWAMLDNRIYFERFGHMPKEKIFDPARTTDAIEVGTSNPTLKKAVLHREAVAKAGKQGRKTQSTAAGKGEADAFSVNLAFTKPDWDRQKDIAERPLWEIAALALDIDPVPMGVSARRKLDPVWKGTYLKLVTAMCDALSPHSDKGIFFDASKPANMSRIGNKRDLKFVRVDAASAATFVVKQCKQLSLPQEFAELQTLLAQSVSKTDAVPPKTEMTVPVSLPKKSQEQANETKASKILTALLYVVVEQEMGGWAAANVLQRKGIVIKMLEYLDRHDIRSKRGMSAEAIEDILDVGMVSAPLRPLLPNPTSDRN